MRNEKRITLLRALDPAHDRPGYWERFRAEIMERAAFELARRRELARESVELVLSGWSRSLVPVAVAAAVIAAIMLGSETTQNAGVGTPLVLEEVLATDLGDEVLQTVIAGEAHASAVAFMAFVEGDRP
jgi:negative regulator of sigma E activity